MNFESVFSKSWKEYKKNFRVIFLLTLILVGIPLIIGNIGVYWLASNDVSFYEALVTGEIEETEISLKVAGSLFLLGLLTLILYIIYEAGLIKDSLKGKFDVHRTTSSGMKNFWKLIWFFIVTTFFLVLLFTLLIIPGIIFLVYWLLGIYVYFDSNKTVIESLITSFYMVKGNWWRMLGYTLVLFLGLSLVGAIVSLIGFPTEQMLERIVNPDIDLFFSNIILENIASLIYTMISVPFTILFYKNVYLGLRGNSKTKKKKK